MARVVMLLSNDFVADPRVEKEAVALSEAGHEVTVLAWDRSRKAQKLEERGPIRVERLGPAARHGAGLRNVMLYREFWREAAHRLVALRPDVVHCHDADTIPAGTSALRTLRFEDAPARLVVDFHELYREGKMVPGRGSVRVLARALVDAVERSGARAASLVIVANPGTAEHYRSVGAKEVLVLENAPDAALFVPRGGERDEGLFTVCFIGQKRYIDNLETLMRAVQRFPNVEAYLGGGGVDEAAVEERADKYERVRTEGRLRYAEIPGRYEGCDAVYAVNDVRVGNMRVNFPVKAMEGMACGLPVIVNGGTWIGDYVAEKRVGLTVDGADLASVEGAIGALRDDPALAREMGSRGRAMVEAGLNWKAVAEKLVSAYAGLVEED